MPLKSEHLPHMTLDEPARAMWGREDSLDLLMAKAETFKSECRMGIHRGLTG